MNSGKFCVLLAFFLLFFSVNVFAEYKFDMSNVSLMTVANPDGSGDDGQNYPPSQDAYYSNGSTIALTDTSDPDWVELKFTMKNVSTNDAGEPIALNEFAVRINLWQISTPSNWYVYHTTSDPIFCPDCTEDFSVVFPVNGLITNGLYEVKTIGMEAWDKASSDSSTSTTIIVNGNRADAKFFNPDYVPPPEPIENLNVFLDPITCLDSSGAFAPNTLRDAQNTPVRCDQIDSNTIYYEIMIKDVNSNHVVGGDYAVANRFELICATRPYEGRVMHWNFGCAACGYPFNGIQYDGFPASCEFLHYDESAGNQPMHTDCGISVLTSIPEYSAPPLFTAIPDCIGACPEQDKNVFYNSNGIGHFKKYLNPSEFTFNFNDQKIFKGTITNARTGGNFGCYGDVYYSLYNNSGTLLYSGSERMAINGTNDRSYDGSRDAPYNGPYWARLLKLKGHEAYIVKTSGTFMPSSIFVRPLVDWSVEIPITNTGSPWDGIDDLGNPSLKDILYVDVNVLNNTFTVIPTETYAIDGSDAAHTLNTDDIEKLFIVSFPVPLGLYHNFLAAASMDVILYDEDKWIFDLAFDKALSNKRLIQILNPIIYAQQGSKCFTDAWLDSFCWANYLNYPLLDLNANEDYNFILRLRNPFDFNEHFALSYETNDPGNARLEFEPEVNFIPPFASSEYGYKYAKMILKNPSILHEDANYFVKTTSVKYPLVWDNLDVSFRNFSHNLRIESFKVIPEKEKYSVGDTLSFELIIKNTGDVDERDVNFLVVSSMDSTEIYHAGNGITIPAGGTVTITSGANPLPAIPSRNVFVVEAAVEAVPHEFNLSDNHKLIVLETAYTGDISNLLELNYLFILFVLVVILFVVRKK